jgi:hypothetical protein
MGRGEVGETAHIRRSFLRVLEQGPQLPAATGTRACVLRGFDAMGAGPAMPPPNGSSPVAARSASAI